MRIESLKSLRKEEIEEIVELYKFPLEIFNQHFPQYKNNFALFNHIFATFDINKEEALDFINTIKGDIEDYLLIEGVLFDLKDFKDLKNGKQKFELK